MAASGVYLKLLYGPQSSIPDRSSSSNGNLYVATTTAESSGIYGANLYFDLGDKRYQIQSDIADHVSGTLSLELGGDTAAVTTGFNGSSSITWKIPAANASRAGLVTTGAQTFAGKKTFTGNVLVGTSSDTSAMLYVYGAAHFYSAIGVNNIVPETTNTGSIGTSENAYQHMYATTFHGDLSGNATSATSATSADHVGHYLKVQSIEGSATNFFNGSADATLNLSDLVADGETIPLSMIPAGALERIVTYANLAAAQTALAAGEIQPGDMVHILDTGIMYYVKDNGTSDPTLEQFIAGTAAEAAKVSNKLTLTIAGTTTEYDGSVAQSVTIGYANGSTSGGLVSTSTQTFAGAKTFIDNVVIGTTSSNKTLTVNGAATVSSLATATINTTSNNTGSIGASNKKFASVYATTFYGALDGKASTAGTADKVANKLTLSVGVSGITANTDYDGSGAVTLGVFGGAGASAAGSVGLVPQPASGANHKFLGGNGIWTTVTGASGISASFADTGSPVTATTLTISHSNSITSGSVGPSAGVTYDGSSNQSIVVPQLTYDAQGHLTAATTKTLTLNKVVSIEWETW